MEDSDLVSNGNGSGDRNEELPRLPSSTGSLVAASDAKSDHSSRGVGQEKGDDADLLKTNNSSAEMTDDIFSEEDPSENGSRSKQREPGLNVIQPGGWSGSKYDDYDVVTVHGIRDDYARAWIDNRGEAWWVRERLFEDRSVREVDYCYEIDEDSLVYAFDGISELALDLLTAYAVNRRALEETETDRPIIWVCHDLGGTIVKKALSLAVNDTARYGKIGLLTTAIFFLGVPHRFESIDSSLDQLHQLLLLPGPDIAKDVSSKVRELSLQVVEINEAFLATKLLDRAAVFNIYAENVRRILKEEPAPIRNPDGSVRTTSLKDLPQEEAWLLNKTAPFTRYSHIIGHSFEAFGQMRAFRYNHQDLVSSFGRAEEHWVSAFKAPFEKNGCPIGIKHELITYQAWLLSLSPPTRSLSTAFYPMLPIPPVIEWINEQPPFVAFSAPGGGGSRLLHIYGSRDAVNNDVRETSRLFYLSYDYKRAARRPHEPREPQKTVIYFEFDQTDSRYNNLSSMLTYLINAIVWRFWKGSESEAFMSQELNFMSTSRAYSLEDLYKLYRALRYGISTVIELTIFLGCFDQCTSEDERGWFLGRILDQRSYCEAQDGLILSTGARDGLGITGNLFPNEACINLEEYYSRSHPKDCQSKDDLVAHEVEATLEKLIATRPVYKRLTPQLELLLKEYTSRAPHLRPILLTFLTCGNRGEPTRVLADRVRKLSPATTSNIMQAVHSILEPESRKLLEKALHLVKHAAEPWSPESLSEALAVLRATEDSNSNDVLQELSCDDLKERDMISLVEQLSCGIIVVTGRDVKFAHPSFYDVPDLGFDIPDEAGTGLLSAEERAANINGTIAAICLHYLYIATTGSGGRALGWLSPENFDGGPWDSICDAVVIAHPRTSMAEYAVRFWPHHYKASGQVKPRALVRRLFATPSTRAGWETSFYLLSNPFTRIHRSYMSPLPVYAMLELEDMVDEELQLLRETGRGKGQDEKTLWYAITEAVRAGNETIFWCLLGESRSVYENELEVTLFWAAATGNVKILNAVISKIPHLETFPWPLGGNIVSRAAAAGLDDLLVAMSLSGHDMNKKGDYWEATPIIVAIWHGRASTVGLLLLDSGMEIDLTIPDVSGDIPLNTAASRGFPRVLGFLLQEGVKLDVNGRDRDGRTAVEIAAMEGNHKALEMLLGAGARPTHDSIDEESSSDQPLIIAARIGFRECTRILLQHGADPNVECRTRTAFYEAVSEGHLGVVRLLLENDGHKLDVQNLHKVTPEGGEMLLLRAVSTGNASLVSLLIEHVPSLTVDSVDSASREFTKTPLSRACARGHLAVVKLLLETHKADINYTGNDSSDTPLLAAVYERQWDVVGYLLQTQSDNIDANWAFWDGLNALHLAVRHPRLVAALLKMKSPPAINSMSIFGTALFMATALSCAPSVELLLEKDPRPDTELVLGDREAADSSRIGYTALQWACKNFDPECVRILLRAGASSTAENKEGHDAVEIILVNTITPKTGQGDFREAEECLRLLLVSEAYHTMRNEQRHIRHSICEPAVVGKGQGRERQERHEQRSQTQKQWQPQLRRHRTRLHSIREKTPLSLVRILIEEARAPFDVQDDEGGHTPLSLAVQLGNEPVARYLIERGARVNVFAPAFGSILHIAVANANIGMARFLVAAGADPEAVDPDFGESLVYTALSPCDGRLDGVPRMVRYLVDKAKAPVNKMGGRLGYPVIRAAEIAMDDHLVGTRMIRFLVRRDAAVDVADAQGRRAVHVAAASFWDDGLRALVDAGAAVQVPDNLGRTPLHFAAATTWSDCLEYLLTLADEEPGRVRQAIDDFLGAVDNDGWTPLMWAARRGLGDFSNSVQVLANRMTTEAIWRRTTAKDRAGEWSALKLMNFSRKPVSPHLLAGREGEVSPPASEWADPFHKSPAGKSTVLRCESCLAMIVGAAWKCIQCDKLNKPGTGTPISVTLCFKCHSNLPNTHPYPAGHSLFEKIAPMYDGVSRVSGSNSGAGSVDNNDNNDTSSDQNASDGGGEESGALRRGEQEHSDDEDDDDDDDEEEEEEEEEADGDRGSVAYVNSDDDEPLSPYSPPSDLGPFSVREGGEEEEEESDGHDGGNSSDNS